MAPRTHASKDRSYHQFSALLYLAIMEWVLMLLLLLEGLLSYLVMMFARVCNLQPPCLMCTRLDHILGKVEPGFYRDLMCSAHKAEASSWAFCHIHKKLADVHSMCETCLLSFATEKKYRSLAGKLGVGIGSACYWHDYSCSYAAEAQGLKEDVFCSCCSSLSKAKCHTFVFPQSKASGVGIEEVGRDDSRNHHVRYSELKTSDSESEAPQRGDNVRSLAMDATDYLMEDFSAGHPQIERGDNIHLDYNAQEKVINHSDSVPALQVQDGGSDDTSSQNYGKLHSIQADSKANLQTPDQSSNQQVTEDSDTTDKLEDNVWHNADSSTKELPRVAESAETDAKTSEAKVEFTDTTIEKDSYRVHKDLKLLLSQIPASQVTDSWNDSMSSPSVQEHGEQAIQQNISRILSLERNYSGISFFERNYSGISESMVSEVEGESTIDQLKRRVELDRKSISLLWKELEEERSASAVAANQAMAMITKLQEEKAAMQMEASQYQRMMEEQSKYDREDLHKTTDLVEQLEAEIESYKTKLGDELPMNDMCDQMHLSGSNKCGSRITRSAESLSGFENEKAYIAKCLRKLKWNLHQILNNSKFIEVSKLSTKDNADETNCEDVYDDADETGEMESSVVEYVRRNGNNFNYLYIGTKGLILSKDDPKCQYYAMISENDLASFEDELSELIERLISLEADRNFPEHSMNSLKSEKEGL